MDFFQHTTNWIKGEIFEATLIGASGIFIMLSGIIFWKFGNTATTKSLFIPLIIVGVLFISSGVSMYYSSQKRLIEFKELYTENKTEFIQSEKQRVEDFQYMYTVSKVLATVGFVITLIAFWFTKSYTFQGIAIGLALLGLASIVIDYFSEERASMYYNQIELVIDK